MRLKMISMLAICSFCFLFADSGKLKSKQMHEMTRKNIDYRRIKSPEKRQYYQIREALHNLGFTHLKMRKSRSQNGAFIVVVTNFKEPSPASGLKLKGAFKRFRFVVRFIDGKIELNKNRFLAMGYLLDEKSFPAVFKWSDKK